MKVVGSLSGGPHDQDYCVLGSTSPYPKLRAVKPP